MLVEKLPKNQKEYYHNKIREYEKRTGKSMNVKNVSYYDYNSEYTIYNFSAALDMLKKHGCYIFHEDLVEEDPYSHGTHWNPYGFAQYNHKTYIYYFETKQWGRQVDDNTLEQYKNKSWKVGKPDTLFFPKSIQNKLSFESAVHLLNTGRHYITVPEKMFSTDDNDSSVGKVKVGIALKNNIPHYYFYEVNKWGMKANLNSYKNLDDWKYFPLPVNLINESRQDNLERDSFENKHIGSNFDDFAKENNIYLVRDINWAVKMIDAGKMMTREGNRSLTLFPKKYDHAESTITTEDLFAEDWMIVSPKTFKDVLDDLYAGKTIRRKSWHPDFGVGKYAANYGKLIYLDLIADDWEVIDVVAEVDNIQRKNIEDR